MIFMKRIFFAICMLLAIYVIQSCNSNSNTNMAKDSVDSANDANKRLQPVDAGSAEFAVKAANGGMMEVEGGKLASEKASSKRIKSFGDMMVKDHSEANDKLKRIATGLNIALPDTLSYDSKTELNKLANKKGKDFDKAYMNMMLEDHKNDLTEFRRAADNLKDSSIKSFAETTLPVLEKHLDSVEAITGKK